MFCTKIININIEIVAQTDNDYNNLYTTVFRCFEFMSLLLRMKNCML